MQDDDDVTIEAGDDLLAQIREAAGLQATPVPEPEAAAPEPPAAARAHADTFDQFDDATISADDMAEVAAAIAAQKAAPLEPDMTPLEMVEEPQPAIGSLGSAPPDSTVQRPSNTTEVQPPETPEVEQPTPQEAPAGEPAPVAPSQPWVSEAPKGFPAASTDRTDGWAPTRRDVTSAATSVAPVRREPVLPPWGMPAIVAVLLVAAVAIFVLVRSSGGGEDAPSDEPVPAVEEGDGTGDDSGGSGGAGGG